jgi:putative ABC transport system permease protein
MLRTLANSIQTTFLALLGNKIRSALTMLGVIIGVFSIITLIGLGEGVKKDITSEVAQLGSNIIIVLSGKVRTSEGGFNPAASVGASTLTQRDLEEIRTMPDITEATPMGLMAAVPSAEATNASGAMVIASEPTFLDFMKIYHLSSGRNFTAAENDAREKVMLLGKDVRLTLFPNETAESVLGKSVWLSKTEFRVIGTVETDQTNTLFNAGGTSVGLVIVPFQTAKSVNENTQLFRFGVKAREDADIESVSSEVQAKLQELHGADDTTVLTQKDIVGVVDNILSLITKAIVGLASISLVVGGIGIMNIMLVSVTERTKEIGLRKAVGASNGAILTQFLAEAVVLSVIGGAIGVALSMVASIIVKSQVSLTILINAHSIGIALLFSVAVGVIFGVAPAIRAARLNPIDALRYE